MDEHISAGLSAHFGRYRERLSEGEGRLGFKVAFNVPAVQARLGLPGSLVAGLTQRTRHPGGGHSLATGTRVAVEPEVSVRLARGLPAGATPAQAAGAIAAICPAIEVVDYTRPLTEIGEVIRDGVYHRAVAFGADVPPPADARLDGVMARALHNDKVVCDVDAQAATGSLPELLLHIAGVLEPHGLELAEGDRVILGSMSNPVSVAAGDRFVLELAGLGAVELTFDP